MLRKPYKNDFGRNEIKEASCRSKDKREGAREIRFGNSLNQGSNGHRNFQSEL